MRGGSSHRIVVLLRRLQASPNGDAATSLLGACELAALGSAIALRDDILEAGGKARVEVLAAGPRDEDEALIFARACGANIARRVWDPVLAGADYYAIARVLAKAVRLRRFSWVFCGDRSGDEGLGATGPAVAQFLEVRHLSGARQVRVADRGAAATVQHRSGELVRELRIDGPAVICVADGPEAAPSGAKGPRRPTRPRAIDLDTLGLLPEELRHRQRYLGTADCRPGSMAEILPSADALVERLRSEGLIPG